MKKQILILTVSLLTLLSCKEDLWKGDYYEVVPDTFSFKDREMEIQVMENTTSFFISATKEDVVKEAYVTVDHEKSTAKHNFHYSLPECMYVKYGFAFPADKKETTFEVKIIPKNITEPITITFYDLNYLNINSNPEKYIDTLKVKLIPMIK